MRSEVNTLSALRSVLLRSNVDLAFRESLLAGDTSVLDGTGLSPEEAAALASGDENAIYRLLGDTQYFHIREQGDYSSAVSYTIGIGGSQRKPEAE